MSARQVSGGFVLAAAVIVTVAQVGWRRTDAGPTKADEARPLGPNGIGLTYTPMPEWFEFRKSAEVQRWIDQNDTKAMIEHAWELWGGLTSLTSQEIDGKKYPVFETWVDEFTVFPPAKDLRAPIAEATAKGAPVHTGPPTRSRRARPPRRRDRRSGPARAAGVALGGDGQVHQGDRRCRAAESLHIDRRHE